MNRRTAGFALLAASPAALLAAAAGPVEPTQHDQIAAELAEITETRQLIVMEPGDDEAVSFNMNEPGLKLTFKLSVPDGLNVLEVHQPEKVIARDSRGTDLSQIEEDFMGERTYAEIGYSFDGPPTELTFQLTQPARAAEHFSVQATFDAVVYTGTVTHEMEVGNDWTEADPALFGGEKVTMRFGKGSGFFGDSFGLEVRPGTVAEHIESVAMTVNGVECAEGMSAWNDAQVNYFVDGEFEDDASAQVTLTIRTGLGTAPMTIDLRKQPLP